MRIIAGSAGGRTLCAPKGLMTRPTLDRVRESLFSILMPRIEGAYVLDLFAGSGALGLEALSRGAEKAIFVDHGRAAQQAVRKNIEALGFLAQAVLLPMEYQAALTKIEKGTITLCFIDPPYEMAPAAVLKRLAESGCLAADARVAYEHARDNQDITAQTAFTAVDARHYGDTTITFMRLTGGIE